MDSVYANATLTIVAAAGEDAAYGLPGCGTRARKRQHQVTFNGCTMVHVPQEHTNLQKAKWATRAWTYQEGYFSPRKLIFTDYQVLYICASGYTTEAMACTTDSFLDIEARNLSDLVPATREQLGDVPAKQLGSLKQKTQVYSCRNLSYQSDILNAFQGVLTHFESVYGIRHLWGVPLDAHGSSPVKDYGLCLDWFFNINSLPAVRRFDFPSWSWIGWSGSVVYKDTYKARFNPLKAAHDHPVPITEWSHGFSVKTSTNTEALLKNLVSTNSLRLLHRQGYGKELVICGLMMPLTFMIDTKKEPSSSFVRRKNQFYSLQPVQGTLAVFKITEDVNGAVPVLFDSKPVYEGCFGLLLEHHDKKDGLLPTWSMLVLKEFNGYFERVGIIFLRGVVRIHESYPNGPSEHVIARYINNDGHNIQQVDFTHVGEPLWLERCERRRICLR
jgi:hypothetical protein